MAPVSVFQSVLRKGVEVEGEILACPANSIVDVENAGGAVHLISVLRIADLLSLLTIWVLAPAATVTSLWSKVRLRLGLLLLMRVLVLVLRCGCSCMVQSGLRVAVLTYGLGRHS